MHTIEMQEMSPEFFKCWQAAGQHLNRQVDSGILSWLRAHPYPPFLEHLSFRLGNQLFFVRVEDVSGKVVGPGTRRGLQSVANGCKGHACLMPMGQKFPVGDWLAQGNGWGLIDADSMKPINPIDLVSDEKIEITKWELHDFAVQIVRDQLEKDGYRLMSFQGNPDVDPAIWFVGDSKKPEWVVVRAVRYPNKIAARPDNLNEIAESCAHLGRVGHFASVAFSSPDTFTTGETLPLYRGYGLNVRYTGLEAA